MTIVSGQSVQTGPGSGVSIAAAGGATLNAGPGSAFSLTSDGSGDAVTVTINFTAGSFRFSSGKLGLSTYSIQTPSGTLVASDAVISVDVTGGTFAVESGSASVQTSSGRTVPVSAGQVVSGVNAQGEPVVQAGSAYQNATGNVTASLGNGRVASLQPSGPTSLGQGTSVASNIPTLSLPTPRGVLVSPN
jgi:hypothetical protein